MKVYKQGAFVVIETPTQKTIIPRASFDFDPIGQTGTIKMRSVEDTFNSINEVFSNIEKEDGTSAGANLSDVLSYLSDLPLEGGSGGGSVTITGDDVGLARQNQFDAKYTGFVIDLENPDGGSWPDFPFSIEQVNIVLNLPYTIADFSDTYDDVQNVKELAEYLNTIQNYFYFKGVGATSLGIMSGKLPVSELQTLEINAAGDILEYQSSSLTYQTASEAYSNQDELLLVLEQNAQKQNAPKGLGTRREEKPFPTTGLILALADLNPFRHELLITNNSTENNLFVGYGSSTTNTDYTIKLEPGETLITEQCFYITASWEAGSTSGTVLITETI
ncbi:MAG: hypothetical protein GY865_10985 [candidate division Zixibacteria bacterium]|nr:hypothetical protein [candidate division Zixibacteria bacterium]